MNNTEPYISDETMQAICNDREIHLQWDGEVYSYDTRVSFRVENDGLHCPGYLKLIEYLNKDISWLNAMKLNKFIRVDQEKEHDYYATRTYDVWVINVNALIDYMVDELKIQINPMVER